MIRFLTETENAANILEKTNDFISKNLVWFIVGISVLAITAITLSVLKKPKKKKR